ncbi:MAG: hypothetical protein MJA29_05745, partial [Candidatus Omnitrophica bacterium]|nr:hypothetical protein [Candidatus Omnitrophota bacterium]
KGSIVLIKQDKQPRLSWPLGVVEELYPGRDGLSRSVRLRTANGELTRSIQCLYDLEVSRAGDGPSTLAPNIDGGISEVVSGNGDSGNSVNSGNSKDSGKSADSEEASAMDHVDRNANAADSDIRMTRYGRVVKRPNYLMLT